MTDQAGAGERTPNGTREASCPRCGARFGCGVNAATCWCAGLEALAAPAGPADGSGASCYCPRCLRELLDAQR